MNKILQKPEYAFLHQNEHLAGSLFLVGYGGSIAYGTNIASSDIDIRGIAYNSKEEILRGTDFEQVVDTVTDTTIYSFRKMMKLLLENNPNTLEILGLRPCDYLYMDKTGKELVRNAHMFLSKRCVFTFGGYANAQLRRLQQRSVPNLEQSEREVHIRKSIEHASYVFKTQVSHYDDEELSLYIDTSEKPEYDTEMFIDVNLRHYPLRDLNVMYQDVSNIVRDYDKMGKRNKIAFAHQKISKHAMHLVRLYLMCIDILTHEEIRTYREDEHELLMDIRNGKYMNEHHEPTKAFFDIVDDLTARMDEAAKHTQLPDEPDFLKINQFIDKTCEMIIMKGVTK